MAMLALQAIADPPAIPRIVPDGPRIRPVVQTDGTILAYRADGRSGHVVSVSSKCRVTVDGEAIATRPLAHESAQSISYVRLRSAAQSPDPAGSLIGRIQFRSLDLP
jgi:hypothetical protein